MPKRMLDSVRTGMKSVSIDLQRLMSVCGGQELGRPRRAAVVPLGRALVSCPEREQLSLAEAWTSDHQANRQPFGRKPARDRECGKPETIEGQRVVDRDQPRIV